MKPDLTQTERAQNRSIIQGGRQKGQQDGAEENWAGSGSGPVHWEDHDEALRQLVCPQRVTGPN